MPRPSRVVIPDKPVRRLYIDERDIFDCGGLSGVKREMNAHYAHHLESELQLNYWVS
jgi:hypothetical protein